MSLRELLALAGHAVGHAAGRAKGRRSAEGVRLASKDGVGHLDADRAGAEG